MHDRTSRGRVVALLVAAIAATAGCAARSAAATTYAASAAPTTRPVAALRAHANDLGLPAAARLELAAIDRRLACETAPLVDELAERTRELARDPRHMGAGVIIGGPAAFARQPPTAPSGTDAVLGWRIRDLREAIARRQRVAIDAALAVVPDATRARAAAIIASAGGAW